MSAIVLSSVSGGTRLLLQLWRNWSSMNIYLRAPWQGTDLLSYQRPHPHWGNPLHRPCLRPDPASRGIYYSSSVFARRFAPMVYHAGAAIALFCRNGLATPPSDSSVY